MAVSETYTNRDICTDALRKLEVTPLAQEPEPEEFDVAIRGLGRMLKSWQNRGENLWLTADMSVAAASGINQALDPIRPVSIQSVRFKRGGTETVMTRLNRRSYDLLPNKDTVGTPTCFYFDRQRESAILRVWPTPATPAAETFEITYTREFEDVVENAEADVPAEWYDAVVYGLAARLSDEFSKPAQNIIARAEEEFRLASGFDREESVYFVGDDW